MPQAKLRRSVPAAASSKTKRSRSADAEPTGKPARKRRSGPELRLLLLEAARRLFAERGYARTSTRAIAEAAGVTEVLLFRYFQSKAELFREAVAKPFEQLMSAFVVRNAALPPLPEAKGRPYALELFELLSRERGLVLALIADRTFGSPEEGESLPGLPAYFAEATNHLRTSYAAVGREPMLAPELGARLSFATIVAAALFGNWMFKDVPEASDPEALKQAIGDHVLYGLFGCPPADPPKHSSRLGGIWPGKPRRA